MASTIAVAGIAAGAIVTVPATAQAATCYGDYCSGKDPQSSGCAADAYTVVSTFIPGTRTPLELRWSPSCKTNWARTQFGGNGLQAYQCGTGYSQNGYIGRSDYYYTAMIYSPRYGVSARWNGPPGNAGTSCA